MNEEPAGFYRIVTRSAGPETGGSAHPLRLADVRAAARPRVIDARRRRPRRRAPLRQNSYPSRTLSAISRRASSKVFFFRAVTMTMLRPSLLSMIPLTFPGSTE